MNSNSQTGQQLGGTIDEILARIDSYQQIARFLQANRDLPGNPNLYQHAVLVCLNHQKDPRTALSAWMEAAIEADAQVSESTDGEHAGLDLHFGTQHIQVYAKAELLGETVQVMRQEWRLGVDIPARARLAQAGSRAERAGGEG